MGCMGRAGTPQPRHPVGCSASLLLCTHPRAVRAGQPPRPGGGPPSHSSCRGPGARSWAGVWGGARSIPHIVNGSAQPLGCCSGHAGALRHSRDQAAPVELLLPPHRHPFPACTLLSAPCCAREGCSWPMALHPMGIRSGWDGAAQPAREGWKALLPGRGDVRAEDHSPPEGRLGRAFAPKQKGCNRGMRVIPIRTAHGGSFAPD